MRKSGRIVTTSRVTFPDLGAGTTLSAYALLKSVATYVYLGSVTTDVRSNVAAQRESLHQAADVGWSAA